MMTQTCILKFKDGAEARATVSVATPYDEQSVAYSGATDRLKRRHERATPGLLKILFRNLAREMEAEFSEDVEGTYDYAE